jgi:hypothetical protein
MAEVTWPRKTISFNCIEVSMGETLRSRLHVYARKAPFSPAPSCAVTFYDHRIDVIDREEVFANPGNVFHEVSVRVACVEEPTIPTTDQM